MNSDYLNTADIFKVGCGDGKGFQTALNIQHVRLILSFKCTVSYSIFKVAFKIEIQAQCYRFQSHFQSCFDDV